ncbi:MFS transporter [Photobacterium rosenbergii]|uniref:MFS transporter n=1 Tax=Photobacterium rosenbergii TaxID=294936 RepID=A0ABU3ZNE7_9GAMM|nr:MFS transporter [Photobacterium rosenbergii]MDV5171589.1 MFS transporter [Photobacterium rosenbergii]
MVNALLTKHPSSFDLLGQVLIVIALGSLSYAAIGSGVHGLLSTSTIASLLASFISFSGFIAWQNITSKPMVPLSLFRIPNIMIANTVGFTFMFGYFGLPFLMSMYLQHVRGFTALQTGLTFLPMMLMGLMLTPITHKLVARCGSKRLITAGLALMTLGLASLALLAELCSAQQLSALMALVGLSGPLISPPSQECY